MGRHRNERGASLVEFALLLPVLVLILFGIIDFGSLYNNYQAVRQGARDGMRQAIVADPSSGASCTTQGGNVPTSPISNPAHDWICYTKNRVGLGDTNTRVRLLWKAACPTWTAAAPICAGQSTASAAFSAGQPLMVCVQYKASSLSGVLAPFINGKVLNTQAETIIEQDNFDLNPPTFPAPSGSPLVFDVHEDSINNAGWPATCDPTKL